MELLLLLDISRDTNIIQTILQENYVDFHMHSYCSIATSKNLVLKEPDKWEKLKAITLVIGTGDFTHPAWIDKLDSKLETAVTIYLNLRMNTYSKMI